MLFRPITPANPLWIAQPTKWTKLSIAQKLRHLVNEVEEEEFHGKYTLQEELGTGATSTVYRAIEQETGIAVAVKVFDKAALIDLRENMNGKTSGVVRETAVQRVQRRLKQIITELQILHTVDHPNVIKFYNGYETSHAFYLVHELVDGSDLLDHILKHGRMSENEAAIVIKQLISALRYIHGLGIYHRDLKLENVLIGKDNQIKLIDFGLSELSPADGKLHSICGTPMYCGPELLFMTTTTKVIGVDGAPADMWSLGVLAYALTTGCPPFSDISVMSIRTAIIEGDVAYPYFMSDDLRSFLEDIFQIQPNLRPSANEAMKYPWLSTGAVEARKAHLKPLKALVHVKDAEVVEVKTLTSTTVSSTSPLYDSNLATDGVAVRDTVCTPWYSFLLS